MISTNPDSILINLHNDQLEFQSSDIQLRKGDNARRKLLEMNNHAVLKNLNDRKDSIFTLTNNNDEIIIPQDQKNQLNETENQKFANHTIYQLRGKKKSTLANQQNTAAQVVIKKTNNIRKFIARLKECTTLLQYKNLQKQHFSYINDKAYMRAHDRVNNIQKFSARLCKFLQKIPVFKPDSKVMIIWDSTLLILAIFFVLVSSIEFSQQRIFTDEVPYLQFIYIIIIIIFSIDIFLHINIGYFDGFTLVEDHFKIFKNYIRHHIFIDTLPIIGYYIMRTTQIQIFQFTSIFRIFKMISIINKIQENYHFQERYPTATTLTRLVFQIFFVAHLCGCGFVYIANIQPENVETWLDRQNLTNSEFYEQYIVSLYYAFITMITVGYGDVVPVTIQERIYTICMTLIACGIFAYSVNTIGQIVLQIEQKNSEQKKQKYEILNYMEGRNIKKEIQQKIFHYLQQLAVIDQQSNLKGILVLNKLPINLRNEIYQDFYGKLLKEQTFFTKNFSLELIEAVALKMKECIYGPGQVIINKQDVDRRLLIIRKGELQLFENKNSQEKSFGNIKKSVIVGYSGFLTGQPYQYGVKSLSITQIVSLDIEDFLDIIKRFPKDYEKFCMIRDSFIFNTYQVTQFCTICNDNTHSIMQCPFVFYSPIKRLVISKSNYSIQQTRQFNQVRKKKKQKALKMLKEIKNSLKQLRVNLVIEQGYEDDLANSFLDLLNNFGNETDKEFYKKTPVFHLPGEFYADYDYLISQNTIEDEEVQFVSNSNDNMQQSDNKLMIQSQISGSSIKESMVEEDLKVTRQISKESGISDMQEKKLNNIFIKQASNQQDEEELSSIPKQLFPQYNKCFSYEYDQDQKKLQQSNNTPNTIKPQIQQTNIRRPSLNQTHQFKKQSTNESKQTNQQKSTNQNFLITSNQNIIKLQLTSQQQQLQTQQHNSNQIDNTQNKNNLSPKLQNQNKLRGASSQNAIRQQSQQNSSQIEVIKNRICDLETQFTQQVNRLLSNGQIQKMQNNIPFKFGQYDEQSSDFFIVPYFDKMYKFNIYYPQFNFCSITKQKNRTRKTQTQGLIKRTLIDTNIVFQNSMKII